MLLHILCLCCGARIGPIRMYLNRILRSRRDSWLISFYSLPLLAWLLLFTLLQLFLFLFLVLLFNILLHYAPAVAVAVSVSPPSVVVNNSAAPSLARAVSARTPTQPLANENAPGNSNGTCKLSVRMPFLGLPNKSPARWLVSFEWAEFLLNESAIRKSVC